MIAAPLLLGLAFLLSLALPPAFTLALFGYAAATTAYSFWLKRQVVVDVLLLAGLYTARILAGAAATGIKPSFWLLAFSMFVFLCLAFVKRYAELQQLVTADAPIAGRGYHASDLPVVLALGSASGMVSVLILSLYIQNALPEAYPTPEWLWLVPPLMLYWITRIWMKAGRAEVDEDPVLFAIHDRQSLLIIGLTGLAFLLAGSGWHPW
jgi:4-hydroxybenzoate polyprenyltransferase